MTDTTKWCAGALPGDAPAHQEHTNSLKTLAVNALRESEHAPRTDQPEPSGAPDQRCSGASGALGARGATGAERRTILEVLLIVWAAGLVIHRRGDDLIVKGLHPDSPPLLLSMLKEHKPELMQVLVDPSTARTA